MKFKTGKVFALLLVGVVLMSLFGGCARKKYTVSSDDPFLIGLGEYRKGAMVELVLELWATDTDYSFFVDGAPADVSFDYNRGYIIAFPMPDHDVHVTYEARNTMNIE